MIEYEKFTLWNTKIYFAIEIKSKYEVVYLQNHIQEENNTTKPFLEPETDFKILGVNNKEGLFDAYIEKGKNIKQPYQVVKKDWLAYNPYRVNVGSIGLKNDSHLYEWISNAYVVFSCKNDLLPEFLYKIFLTEIFNQQIKDFTSGSVRQNLSYDILANLQIPLPALSIQNQLVTDYQARLQQAGKAEQQASELEQGIETYLLDALGIEFETEKQPETDSTYKFLKFVELRDVLEWGVDKILFSKRCFSTKHPLQNLKKANAVLDAFRGKSPDYAENTNTIILNQKCNRWNEIKIEYSKTVNKNWFDLIDSKFKTSENDILINSTGEGTIGRSSLVTKDFENMIYDSHILLLRLNQEKINSLFLVYQFNSNFIQQQINQIKSAQSTKQTELGLDNLFKILFALPPLPTQNEIVAHIEAKKSEIKRLKSEAERLRREAKEVFEKEIFTQQ